LDQWPLWNLRINFFRQLPVFWANQKNLVVDCGNLKLATKKFQLPSSITGKFKIQSLIVWRLNSFLIVMHNEGSPNVMKNVHASILTDVTNMSWQTSTWHPMQNGHITLVLTTLYWIWIDCTISIPYENFHSCDFTKNYM